MESMPILTGDDWNVEQEFLRAHFLQAKTIAGTQKLHSFVPIDTSTLEVRSYSGCEESRIVTIAQQGIVNELEVGTIRGYVGMWWLAHVNQVDADRKEVLVYFSTSEWPQSFICLSEATGFAFC